MDVVELDVVEDSHEEDAIEETVPEICRVCLLGHMIMRDLFVENNVVSLSTKAMSFASVKMVPEDGLPAQVCCDCADKLEAAYEFKLQVEQADNVLRQRYDTLNIKEELFFNEVEVHLEAERGDDVHSLSVEARYQATVDSLNAVDPDEGKSTLLKDHLALLEVEKLAKQQNVLEVVSEHKDDGVSDEEEESGVSAMLRANDQHYLDEAEGTVVELGDCAEAYPDSAKTEGLPDGITAEEHNYIMQQGYALTRNDHEELVDAQESVESMNNESANYLSLIADEMSPVKEREAEQPEVLEIHHEAEQPEVAQVQPDMRVEKTSSSETRRSKRKANKRRRTASDEDSYFENLNLSSRLKRAQLDKSEKLYFLCYLCDKRFVSKDILKEHMRSHAEVRRALSLRKAESSDGRVSTSPTKVTPTKTTNSENAPGSLSGKKANKCPHCGKEYLYVISFNKHLKQHEKNKGNASKESSFSQEDTAREEAKESWDQIDRDEARESEAVSRVTAPEEKRILLEDQTDPRNDAEAKSHARSLSRNDTLSGDKCPESFANRLELLEHSTNFKCNTCEREFDGLEKLRRHRSEHVVEGVLSQQDLEDNLYESEFEAKIRDNSAAYEKSVELATCRDEANEPDEDSADRTVNSWPVAMAHEDVIDREDVKDVRLNDDNWTEPKNHEWPSYIATCSSKKLNERNMGNYEARTKHVCKLCRGEFTTKDNLRRHVEQEYACRTRTFKCTDCGKIFGNELTLRNHLFATDHKTILQGQPYDPNKRMKRVAAKAAQKIIDKIKTEDDIESSEFEENEIKTENHCEEMQTSSQDSKTNSSRWSRQEEDTTRKISTNHTRRRHNYECETCGRKCRSKQSLAKHVSQHRAKESVLEASEKSDRRAVVTSRVPERSSIPQHTNKPTSLRCDLKHEDDTDNENSDFESGLDWPVDSHECPTCKKKYSTKKSLLRHQLLHEKPNFECDICNVKFYRKDKLKSHYDKCSEKNPDQVRKCNICGEIFENNEILRLHRGRHVDEGLLTEEDLRELEPGTEEGRDGGKVARKRRTDIVGLECTECNKRYTSRKGLLRHIQVHEGKKYLCDICPKKFYRREHLKIHVAKHNMIKPYKCPRCTKRFIKEEQLSTHLAKHDRTFKKPKEADTSKRFLCEICSKSFTQSTTLIAHLRAHNGIKPYVCEVCARPFTTNAYLKMHMRTHTQERPYSCQYCSRAFARADTLANHLTSHTGEAKYHCKYCPKNFRRLKSLKEHVFIHTGQRPYACPTCDRRFNNNGSRYAHSKRCKQNHLQNTGSRVQTTISTSPVLQEHLLQPIRLHQLSESHEWLDEHEEHHQTQIQLVKSQSIKTITIARTTDDLTGTQMMQQQEILMPLILPLTVTLTDADEEVILPEGTKIYTTA